MLVYLDTEYKRDGAEPLLANFLPERGPRVSIDFRNQASGRALLAALMDDWRGETFLAFAAHAEISFLITCGIDVSGLKFIDLMSEARMITCSHPRINLPPARSNLLTTLDRLGIATRGDRVAKKAMIATILGTEADQWAPETWDAMVDYCWSDVEPLPQLWAALLGMHAHFRTGYTEQHALFRGEYVRACAILEHRSKGFPVNVELLNRIYANRPKVMRTLAERANQQYGDGLYVWNKPRKAYSFNFAGLLQLVRRRGDEAIWKTTPTGRLKTDEDFLDDFVKSNNFYKPLAATMHMLRHFRSTDLRPLVKDGFVKGLSLPCHGSTGRNQPMVSRGFILNMQPWLRSLVVPPPGYVIVACDWSQQEIVIAAALSGDKNLAALIATGDVYLALAKAAGAIPADATKKSHPIQRQTYKSSQLGLGYGMQAASLGLTIYQDLCTQAEALGTAMPVLSECKAKAEEILTWHRRAFATFWDWNESVVWYARRDGYTSVIDGWTTFANRLSSTTRLGNFPVQASGAVILRQAVKHLAKHDEIQLVCTLHDAIYILVPEADEMAHTATLTRCMTQATSDVLDSTRQPLPIKIDIKRFTHETGYTDERDTTTLPAVLDMLAEAGV